MKQELHTPGAPLRTIQADEGDWDREAPAGALWMTQQMLLIRRFEEALLDLKAKELIHGPVHTSIGQEAVAAGLGAALGRGDKIGGTHRAHHLYLAKVLNAERPAGHDPLTHGITPAMDAVVRVLLHEIMGLAEGCCRGRGGSMHLYHEAAGVIGTNAIVGGGIPIGTGVAWAEKRLGRDSVTVCCFGDGALYQGVFHEAANLGALHQAPVIYFLENNGYAVATNRHQACSAPELFHVAAAYGMPGYQVDGMDPLAIALAVRRARSGQEGRPLPCFIEARTYRYFHHAGGTPGSAFRYRSTQEEDQWRERDPIALAIRQLTRRRLLDEAKTARLEAQARECVERAVRSALDPAAAAPRIREAAWPDPATLPEGVRDETLMALTDGVEAGSLACTREIKYSDAIAEVTGRWLEKDPTVVVLGEEVANFGGGAYGATKGLPAKYPERIINTPITEAGFCGLACGAAMNGMHPVVEIMFTSFALVAADQLFNQIGQLTHIYGGHARMPLVVRTRLALGLGYGAQHSMDPVALFSLFPGWRVFVPTTPFDYIGLFNAAMRSRSPVVLVEHHEFYNRKGWIPEGTLDFTVPPGRAKVAREGRDVTALAYSFSVLTALEAAERLEREGLSVEVIDLRTLDDAGLDYATIGRSLEKTKMLVTVEQACESHSVGRKVAAECARRFLDAFDGAPTFVTGANVPTPVSRRLESACMPTVEQVADALRAAALRRV
jgi:2-oxoisovalerate dehydrogenase E1 component